MQYEKAVNPNILHSNTHTAYVPFTPSKDQ